MRQTRLSTIVLLPVLLLSMVSCERFTGSSNVPRKPTQVVDFPSMVGKSLLEMTTMLGQATPTVSCFKWELSEGELSVCYETGDYAKRWMSSIDYKLKPEFGVGSTEEMMTLLNINVQGKTTEKHHKGFLIYNDLSINGKTCFADVHPQSQNLIFGRREPRYVEVQLFIKNSEIRLYKNANREGTEKTFYEQQTDINLSVGSVWLEDGDWEVCTGANYTGKCEKLLDDSKYKNEYSVKLKNFSSFGLGETIRSVRPVEKKAR